jgi:hypothetical protein
VYISSNLITWIFKKEKKYIKSTPASVCILTTTSIAIEGNDVRSHTTKTESSIFTSFYF